MKFVFFGCESILSQTALVRKKFTDCVELRLLLKPIHINLCWSFRSSAILGFVNWQIDADVSNHRSAVLFTLLGAPYSEIEGTGDPSKRWYLSTGLHVLKYEHVGIFSNISMPFSDLVQSRSLIETLECTLPRYFLFSAVFQWTIRM